MTARRALYLALLAWLLLLAVPFLLSPARPAKVGRTLAIISPHSPEILDEFIAAFEKKKAAQGDPVHVERILVGGSAEVSKRVENDFKAISEPLPLPAGAPEGTTPERKVVRAGVVDVMWGGGSDPYIGLGKIGALQPFVPSPEVDAAIPDKICGVAVKNKDHLYIGTAFTGFGIVVNKQACAAEHLPEPKDWDDLADPRFFNLATGAGRLGNADIRQSGAIRQCYEAVLQSQGWEHGWRTLICIAGNSAQFYRSSSQTPEEVGMANVLAGFSYDRPAMAEIDHRGADVIAFVLPPLTVIGPDSIAILKGAPEPELAKEFLEFVLSREGQQLWLLKPGRPGGPLRSQLRRPAIRADVYTLFAPDDVQVLFNPFSYSFKRPDGSPFVFDDKLASKRRRSVPDLAGAALIDTHPELVRAWARVVKDGCRPEALKALAEMPIGEKEIGGLDAAWGKGDEGGKQREATLIAWKIFFRNKYNRIAAEGQ